MKTGFRPGGLPAWIGSLPVNDHEEAARLMMTYTPDIPLWIQLPHSAAEGMVAQFASGMPGLKVSDDRVYIDTGDDDFEADLLHFFEAYMAVSDGSQPFEGSRFELPESSAPGFYTFLDVLDKLEKPPVAIKGQITGPFTFGVGMTDQEGRAVFYNDQLRDAAVKMIAMKARWQVRRLRKYNVPVILFLDEPALAGFGSSAFISVSRQSIDECFAEVIAAIHEEGALAGVHVCANAEWPVILDSAADIVSFDAYSYFDKFILYDKEVQKFMDAGKILAWGIVPTGDPEAIEKESTESLVQRWEEESVQLEALGYDRKQIISQSLITPSCGTGSLSLEQATRVIQMTKEVSEKIRKI